MNSKTPHGAHAHTHTQSAKWVRKLINSNPTQHSEIKGKDLRADLSLCMVSPNLSL